MKKPVKNMAKINISTIFHLAGYAHDLDNSQKKEPLYQKINADATIKLAEMAEKKGVKKFIFISSAKAGMPNKGKDSQPKGIYGITKREAEIKLLRISKESQMDISIIRPALVYGPEVKGNLASMISAIRRGWFPPLPYTDNSRSMIHVDDLVRAILLVHEHQDSSGNIYIATDGQVYSSSQIYETLCSVLGKNVPNWKVPLCLVKLIALISPTFKSKINKLMGDEVYSSKELEAIGFKPKLTLRDINETSF